MALRDTPMMLVPNYKMKSIEAIRQGQPEVQKLVEGAWRDGYRTGLVRAEKEVRKTINKNFGSKTFKFARIDKLLEHLTKKETR